MEPQKFKKKLVLNKKTIANIGQGMMKGILGGDTSFTRCIHHGCTTRSNTECCPIAISEEESCLCPPISPCCDDVANG